MSVSNLERALHIPFRLLRPAGGASFGLARRVNHPFGLAAKAGTHACSSDRGSRGYCLDGCWAVVCGEPGRCATHGNYHAQSVDAPIFERRPRWWRAGLFALLVLLGLLTHQSWPTWIAVATAPGVAYAAMHRSGGLRAAWGGGNPLTWFAAIGTGSALVSRRVSDATLGSQNFEFALKDVRRIVADPGVLPGLLADVWPILERSLCSGR